LKKDNKQMKLKGRLKMYMQWPIIMGIALALVDIYIFSKDRDAGIVIGIATLLYLGIYIIFYFSLNSSVLKSLVEFAVGYSQVQKELLQGLDMPYGILDSEAKFLWLNDEFEECLDHENVVGKRIFSVFPEMTREFIPRESDTVNELEIVHNDRDYKVRLKRVEIGDLTDKSEIVENGKENYLISICLEDETELNAANKKLDEERFVTGLIYIDNYDEVLESVEDVKKSLLVGLVDRKLNKAFAVGGGLVKKLEKDKYLVVMRHKLLEEVENEKFSVLDEVKSINIGNEMKVTLSIGIGVNAGSYLENAEHARAAIEQALSRGGDQAVIKDGEAVRYYGGKSQSVEKNTRVKARVKAQSIREIIESSSNVLVMGHKIGDVDSFGSCIGIYRAATALGKRCNIIAKDVDSSVKPLADKFISNPDYDEEFIIGGEQALALADEETVLVVVDVNNPNRVECPELVTKCATKIVIDHHRQGNDIIEGAAISYVEPFASSASEMVAEILQYIKDGVKLKPIEADVLYAGMVIDTNNFTNKSGIRTFEAAAYLKRCGTDTVRVRKLLRNDMKEYRAKADAISRVQVFEEYFAITTCRAEGLTSPTVVAAQAANDLLDITGIKASFVLTLYNEVIYISARSIDEINVQLITEKLGGGGHMNVAGAQLKNMEMDEAIKLVKNTVVELLKNKEI